MIRILALGMLVFGMVNANAGRPSPEGEPAAVTDLALFHYNAGFSPTPGSETLRVRSDGQVIFESDYRDLSGQQIKKSFTVATLDSGRLAAFAAKAALVTEEQLRDEQEGQPMCTDAPSSRVAVVKGDEQIVIAQFSGCHTFVTDTQEARGIEFVVHGLVALSRM